jgi:hypothetical protein
MHRTSCLLLAATLLALPANAQTAAPTDEKQCADQFKAADINNDGVLSSSEIGNAQHNLPASIASKDSVTRSDFMAVCGKKAS